MKTRMLTLYSPTEISRSLADRIRALRLRKEWTRNTLANRAGVSIASLKRFETTGKGSLELVLKVANALARLEDFTTVLQPPPAQSIEELEQRAQKPEPKRGRV